MKSKTSFFNRTVFKKNMTLYWPIWVCYLLYGMVKVPGQLWSRLQQQTDMTAYARDYALYNSLRLEVDVAAIAIMAVVCGMALFGYLFTQKNAYMIHALPVTRGELYVTNMISGLCFLLIPQALVFLVTVVLCLLQGIASVQFLGLWFLSVMGIAFFLYATVCFCVMFTGQLFALPVYFLAVNYVAFAFSSGQAANMAVFSLLNPGDHVLLSDDIYGGTFRIIGDVFGKYGIEHTYVEMDDLDAVKAAIKPNTKMFFVETPTNPMMKVADIQALSEIAKSVGALMVVDNTFLTPYFQNPLKLGADIVTHSSTKYLGGHNDTLSGIVVVKDNEEIAEKIHVHIKSHGSQLAPMDCWLLLRGIKTLPVRMDRHNENAKKVAEWLRTQPKVKKVYYVGFEDHKDYATTIKQTRGFGGMISFTVDSFETVQKILRNVDMIMFAESLGGTETLITYPTTQTHEDTPKDVKEKLGITDRFLRMSVGIENVEDIIADLDRAMNS